MTFLAPLALVGLLLLALPILVHLFKPRKMRQTPFSSLRWLKLTQQRLSRRIQWHQWLLFLLRAGLLVLLVLALARPLFDRQSQHTPTDRFIILDAGRIMASKNNEGSTLFDEAKSLATQLAEQTRPGDRTAIVLAGGPPKVLCPLTPDPSEYLAGLQTAAPQETEAGVSSTLSLLSALHEDNSSRATELIFLTSNQRQDWQQSDIQAFLEQLGDTTAQVSVQVIEAGKAPATNAWTAGVLLLDSGSDEDLILRVAVGCCGDGQQQRSVRLTGLADRPDAVQEVKLQPGRLAHVDFRLPTSLSLQGQVAEVRLEPGDAVTSDDRFFLNLDMAWALRILLVEPAAGSADEHHSGLFLRSALEVLAKNRDYSFRLTNRTAATVSSDDVRQADLVILGGVLRLPEETIASLETQVRRGAGLIVFLGPGLDAACYQQQLYRPLQPAEGLLPLPVKVGADASKGPYTLQQIRWTNPLLAPLHDPLLSDLSLCQFQSHATFAAQPDTNDEVLARFEDDTPALLERALEKGRVLFWNTTLDDSWSDLPRHACFVPLVDRMVSYLSAGGVHRKFMVGEPIQLPLLDWHTGDTVTVWAPNGEVVPARVRSVGTRSLLHLDSVAEPGIYQVQQKGSQDRSWPFAVNTGRNASPLAPMDAAELEQWWSPGTFQLIGADAARAKLDSQPGTWSMWPLLIVLAGVLLIVETIYVYRLCPRVNPAAVESVVPKRGLLKPVGTAGGVG